MAFKRASKRVRILITTGDPDGIGLEITIKAINEIGPKSRYEFCVFLDKQQRKDVNGLTWNPSFKKISISHLSQLKNDQQTDLVLIESPKKAPFWVEDATLFCLKGQAQALVTAPLSKTLIQSVGLRDIGHTEIFKRLSKTKNLQMGFLGSQFSVVLGTDHASLINSIKKWTPERLKTTLENASLLRQLVAKNKRSQPMAVLGVNPHAGENGLMGQEERWMKRVIQAWPRRKGSVVGPLVPDAAFLKANWSKYSVYICPFHDQGLIPFKMVHGFDEGVHLTLGLPFVRTSVDHGTAKDLFGLNLAQSGSMKAAIKVAMRLAKGVTSK